MRSFNFLPLFLLVALCACATLPTEVIPTSSPVSITATSPVPTSTQTLPAATPVPVTATLTLAVEDPYPLTLEQRQHLADAALAYVAENPAEAVKVAQGLDYIGAYANPATMCGPLAIAILQDAGLLDPTIPRVKFYYLNPRPSYNESTLIDVFPETTHEKIILEQPVNQIDYTLNPLYPGDFVYLFAGNSGSFEHMLVVSRVDEVGRAYAVTNINTAEGVVIREVILYDPANPGEGQFYEWTDRKNLELGRTGYGGMWLWRFKSRQP